ncbi:MAG: AAA family ATPase [Phycisphaerae bacterium]|nr:ParA family protein [Phycisphaerae bacterium]NIP52480.1 ParA family protein [Phycisphaerae bacterium]NIS51473.1 ParA family protein [Phycisphaerae bacterium]NIU08000.1 ParA family protein [Phycisphaerae bacterium]NIU56745.1 AAA family ATPase [Phycisphaerae bacterium]
MRTIAIANQKGGCGKTTSAVNIAAAYARHGRRTMIMDLDPQGHSTLGLGHNPETLDKTIYHALTNAQIPLPRVIIGTSMEGLDLAPSNILLSGAELELANVTGREFVLSEQFRLVSDQYDVCIMDCPPSLGLLTLNALVASTDVIVPVQVNYFAMEGLRQLLETADIIKMNFQPCYVKILGLLLTFVEDRTLLSRQIQQQMREYFGDLVFETVIHRTVRLAEAPSAGESILTFAPNSKGAAEYMALVEEIITREEEPKEKPSVEETAGETGEETGEETLAEVESQDQLTPLTEEIRNAKK